MTTTVVNNSVFRTFFEKEKLIGPNFIDRYRNLRIMLSVEDKLTYMENPIPVVLAGHTTWVKDSKEIAGLMLMTMVPELQKNMEQRGAYDLLKELKTMFSQQTEQELLQTVRDFHACKHEENMHGMGNNVNELHAMLKLHEQTLLKKDDASALHAIQAETKGSKNAKAQELWEPIYVGNGFVLAVFSLLKDNGFVNFLIDNGIFVSKDGSLYFHAIPRDDRVFSRIILLWWKGNLRLSNISRSNPLGLNEAHVHRLSLEASAHEA
ncbi:hypothetical protein Tco_0411994 [Tanacetum coccineum]